MAGREHLLANEGIIIYNAAIKWAEIIVNHFPFTSLSFCTFSSTDGALISIDRYVDDVAARQQN